MFKEKKGFFFVVTALILLAYIMSNLALWSKTIEMQEDRYSEEFKLSNIAYATTQITEDAMQGFANISANYALYRLNDHSIYNPVKKGLSDEEGYKNIELIIYNLMFEGSADSTYFNGDGDSLVYSDENKSSYTFLWVFKTINESFSKIALELSKPKIEDFSFNQTAIDKISVLFNLSFTVSDTQGNQMSIEKKIPVSFNLSIQGLVDPSIVRELKNNEEEFGDQKGIEKQIFFYPGSNFNPEEGMKISEGGSGEGQGWFYGPVYITGSSKYVPSDDEKPRYVIIGSEEDILNSENHVLFGAYLVISDDEFNTLSITNEGKPTFVSSSSPNINLCEYDKHCFFFVSKFSPGDEELNLEGTNPEAQSYNIEAFRDFVICGFYFQNEEGPSYFQKLFEDSYKESHEEYGMATFLVWEGIESAEESDSYSRLDLEFFQKTVGIRIRGMPGCKYKAMCSTKDSYVGQFKLSRDAMETYLGDYLSMHFDCGIDDWSTCGDLE